MHRSGRYCCSDGDRLSVVEDDGVCRRAALMTGSNACCPFSSSTYSIGVCIEAIFGGMNLALLEMVAGAHLSLM